MLCGSSFELALRHSRVNERNEALWRSDAENPAYFADYAGAFVSDHGKLPPDFTFSFPGPSRIGWVTSVSAILFVPMIGWAAISQVGDGWWSVEALLEGSW
jgi:hypothetical protein